MVKNCLFLYFYKKYKWQRATLQVFIGLSRIYGFVRGLYLLSRNCETEDRCLKMTRREFMAVKYSTTTPPIAEKASRRDEMTSRQGSRQDGWRKNWVYQLKGRDMDGDMSVSETCRFGSGRPGRRCFGGWGWAENASVQIWNWGRAAGLNRPTFSGILDDVDKMICENRSGKDKMESPKGYRECFIVSCFS